jgi:MFS family permease
MQPQLTQGFHITATQFGMLAAFYYWAYTPMQIPVGMIYDKFGVRAVICATCLIAVLGLSIFISATHFETAGLGRFIMGLGASFAYVGTLKLASIWLPPNRFATVAGLATAVGMSAGALSQLYMTKMVEIVGYQAALHSALVAGIALVVVLFLIVRNTPKNVDRLNTEMQTPMNLKELASALKLIFSNRQMWLIGIIGCLFYLPSSVFLDLWGIPYLKSVYELTAEQAVTISSYTFYGWIISGPIIGYFSDKIQRRCLPLTVSGLLAALLLCVVFYVPGLSFSSLSIIFFVIGACCGAHPICFALGKENNPIQLSGTAVAVTNMLIMVGGVIFQPLVGKLLDLHTNNLLDEHHLPVYSASDYSFALSVIPIGVAVGILLSFFLKETGQALSTHSTQDAQTSATLASDAP